MEDLLKRTFQGIEIAAVIFLISGIYYDISNGGSMILKDYALTKMIVGCLLVGIGFGAPAVIYSRESWPMPIKVIIHLGSGCLFYMIVGYFAGFTGGSESVSHTVLIIAVQLAASFAVWLLFMLYYRREARLMNERIQELKKASKKNP